MRYEIVEVDRDYNAVSGVEFIEFTSIVEAEAYCTKHSWTGYSYFVGSGRIQSVEKNQAA